MTLYHLYQKILGADYVETDNAASFSVQFCQGVLYLFFEKSNGAEDWKNNLDFPAVLSRESGKLFVHRGFLRVFQSAEKAIERRVFDKRVKKIVIGGYSHGAALGVLCHEFCTRSRPDLKGKIFTYAFGCPRVFWGRKTERLKEIFTNCFLIENAGDLVARLPPQILGYFHVGTRVRVGEGRIGARAHRQEQYLAALKLFGGIRV